MKGLIRRRIFIYYLAAALVLGGGLSWRLTHTNAVWRLRQVFPGANAAADPLGMRDRSLARTIQIAIFPSYIPIDEPIGLSLTGSPEALDLQERFSRLSKSKVKVLTAHFTRCRILNLKDRDSAELPGYILFDDCDFSELPQDQRSLLRPYNSSDPADAKKFSYGAV